MNIILYQYLKLKMNQFLKTTTLLLLILILSVLNIPGNARKPRQIEVPALENKTPIYTKLGLSKTINQPDFQFAKVYRKEIQKVQSDGTWRFPPCIQNRPQIQFTPIDQVEFDGVPSRPIVITDFADVEYSQFLLDVFYDDSQIYAIFKNGKVAWIKLNEQAGIKEHKVFQVLHLPSQTTLETGYFIKVENYLLFVNQQFAIQVHDHSASVLDGYLPVTNFESAVALQNSTFAVIRTIEGIDIYHFNGQFIKKVQKIWTSKIITQMTARPILKDIIYWKDQKTILVLDENEGVMSLKIKFTFNPDNLPNTTNALTTQRNPDHPDMTSKNVEVIKTENIGKLFKTKLMYLYEKTLYVYSASAMTAYDLDRWPIVQSRQLLFPNIEVRQIYQIGDMVAFIGRNVFSVLYLDRLVNYFEDGNLDRLLFVNDLFISANQGGIQIGKFNLIKPYITCFTQQQSFIGLTQLQFKTYAECNQKYFEKYNLDKSIINNTNEQDICVYTMYRPINYWKVGQIKGTPFLIAFIIFVLILAIAGGIFYSKKNKINRVIQMIQEYSRVNNSESAKPHELAEQMDGGISMEPQSTKNQDQKQNEKKPETEDKLNQGNS